MNKYLNNLLTLVTYVYGKSGTTCVRNFVAGDRPCVVSECECTFYKSVIDASKYGSIYDIVSKAYGLDSLYIYDLRDDK